MEGEYSGTFINWKPEAKLAFFHFNNLIFNSSVESLNFFKNNEKFAPIFTNFILDYGQEINPDFLSFSVQKINNKDITYPIYIIDCNGKVDKTLLNEILK